MNLSAITSKVPSLNFNVGSLSFSPSYLQAGAIIGLLFLLILVIAYFRRHLLDWSLKGAIFGLFFGFLLALIIEGFLIVGGKTAITEFLGWKNPPKPLIGIIDSSRSKLINVLGVSSEIPASVAKEDPDVDDAIHVFQNLDPAEVKKVKSLICEP